ncbi:hypothetical protein [Lactobacillus terrae]|uniref:hypothetical protein n=1 Tax=Lactobacillus terrae TaxID=2269374 RepID=UPI000C1B6F9B|nr:hypothetical protein [Lactobacillus terrae]
MKELLFYDIEVFAHDNFAVFMNKDKEVVQIFHNDYTGCADLIRNKQLVAYNNHYYDDRVLPKMMAGWSPEQVKDLNDQIISGDQQIGKETKLKGTYDCFQQIDVSRPSLKKIEGNLGKMILESDVPFNIARKLTEQEIKDVLFYCQYDVENTIDVYFMREKNYFKTKKHLIEMVDNPSKTIESWNTTTISANVLLNKPLPKWSDFRLGEYDKEGNYELLKLVPPEVRELWKGDKGNLTIEEFDCDIQFGFGGLHGQSKRETRFENVTLWDVTSMYPHIILNLNVLGPASDKYKQILEDRIELKHTNPDLAGAYKLVLNSVYGNLNSKYSMLYNPNALKSVCFYGQIALYTLCKMLSPYVTIVNINTDGIGFISKTDNETLQKVRDEWEKIFNLYLEDDSFDKFIQKDVNNYIGVKSDHIKVKGGDVGRYADDQPFRNNSTRIVDIAVVDKLLYGKDVIDTIQENLDKPHLFQFILQAGGTFAGTYDMDDKKYQNINRVFAAVDEGVHLYKKKLPNSRVNFADAPEKMLVWNDETSNLNDFVNKVDINFYYKLINKVLERWE